jgi:hypothetical protein
MCAALGAEPSLALRRFLESGEVPVDNGIVERLHVPAALTPRTTFFAGGHGAAIASAILASCRLAGVNHVEYSSICYRDSRARTACSMFRMPTQWKLCGPLRTPRDDAHRSDPRRPRATRLVPILPVNRRTRCVRVEGHVDTA